MNEEVYKKSLQVLKKLDDRKIPFSENDYKVLKYLQFLQTKAKSLEAPEPTPFQLSTMSAACKLKVSLDREKLCKVFECEIKKSIINSSSEDFFGEVALEIYQGNISFEEGWKRLRDKLDVQEYYRLFDTILRLILEEPRKAGEYLINIIAPLKMGWNNLPIGGNFFTAKHYLQILPNLQKSGLISIEKIEGYKRCYICGKIGLEDKKILVLLKQDIPLQIVIFLLKHPYSRHRDILKNLNISSPRFSYHLKKLVKHEIIESSKFGEDIGYIIINRELIVKLLIQYIPSSITKMVKDTWKDFGPG